MATYDANINFMAMNSRSAKTSKAEFPATNPPKFPEHWDTRAQAEAIITRTRKFDNGDINPTDMACEVSDLAFRDGVDAGIAYERERCIGVCQAMRPPGGRAWTSEQSACFEALTVAANNIEKGINPWPEPPLKRKALEQLRSLVQAGALDCNIDLIRQALQSIPD